MSARIDPSALGEPTLTARELYELLGHTSSSFVGILTERPGGGRRSMVRPMVGAPVPSLLTSDKGANIWASYNTTTERGRGKRGGVHEVDRLHAFVADLDFKDGAFGGPDEAAAYLEKVSEILGLPTALVFSGGGFHPVWAVAQDEDAHLGTVVERVAANDVFKRMGAVLQAMAPEGVALDSTFTIDRVWRLVGSTNYKDPERPVQVVAWRIEGAQPVSMARLRAVVDAHAPEAPAPVEDLPDVEARDAVTVCGYVQRMVTGWTTDLPPRDRHGWLVSQATRLVAAVHAGCLPPDLFEEARQRLVGRFEELVGGERPTAAEVARAFEHAHKRAEGRTPAQHLHEELGGHTHDEEPDAVDPEALRLDVPVDPMDEAVARIVAMAGKGGGSREQRRSRLEGAFLSRRDLRSLPPLTALVDDYLYLDTLAQLNGERGTFKTFLALDWAASVSVGAAWNGHRVHHGEVLYFAGEGVAKFDDRLTAWELEHGGQEAGVEVFRELVDFAAEPAAEADWVYVAALLSLRDRKPSLVVIDTMARYTSGHDENSAQDMGQLITNLDVLRRVTGACVLVVHHTTRGTTHGRGSTAVEGAMQSVFLMNRGKDVVELSTTKQKDSPEAEPVQFTAKDVPAASSIVLDPVADNMDPFTMPTGVGQHSPNYVRVAAALYRTFGPGTSGGTKTEVRTVLQANEDLRLPGESRAVSSAFYNAWAVLEKRGALTKATGNRFHLTDEAAVEYGLVEAPMKPYENVVDDADEVAS